MSARERLGRARADLLFQEACLTQQEALQAAKDAYAEDPSTENLAAKRAAMEAMHHYRSTFRGLDMLHTVRAQVAMAPQDRARYKAALAKMPADHPDRPKTESRLARLAGLEAALPGLEAEYGPISAYFEAMRAAVTPAPEPTRAPGRIRKDG